MSSVLAQFKVLNQDVVGCTRCERLISYCQKIGREKRRAYQGWKYWAKPVPGFGDVNAQVLILGLAPGAHGSNRTGRPFTGAGPGVLSGPCFAPGPVCPRSPGQLRGATSFPGGARTKGGGPAPPRRP